MNRTPYLLVAFLLIGCGGGGSGSGDAGVGIAPAAPAAVTANSGNGQVIINWEPVAGAVSYNVYQGSTAGITKTTGIKIGSNITGGSFTASGLVNGTGYYFLVTAVNASGESGGSPVKSATPSATPPPMAPLNVRGTAEAGRATISWDASGGAASYNIYYGTASGVTKAGGTRVAGAASPQAVNGLTNGTQYFFVVTAVNGNGESAESFEVAVTPLSTPPPAPAGVTVSSGNGQVTVSWNAVAGATAYNIYYGVTSGVTKANGTKIAGALSPQVITSLTNGIPYYFVVTAVNGNGESAESGQISATATPGGIPITFVLPPSLGSVPRCGDFSYQMGTVTGGAGYPYTVSLCPSGGSPPLGIFVNAGGLIAGVPSSPEGDYPFSVCVTDAAFNQKSQTTFITVAPPVHPGTPSAPSPANGGTGVSTSPTLTWAATSDTDTYHVYFGTANPPPKVATVTANSYTPPAGLTPNTTYYWQIIAAHTMCNLLPQTVTGGPIWSFTTSSGGSGGAVSLTISSAKCVLTAASCTGCGCPGGTLYTMSWAGDVSGPVGAYVVFGSGTLNCGSWQGSGSSSCSRDLASDPASTPWSLSVLNNSALAPGNTYTGEFTVYDYSGHSATASYSMTCPCP